VGIGKPGVSPIESDKGNRCAGERLQLRFPQPTQPSALTHFEIGRREAGKSLWESYAASTSSGVGAATTFPCVVPRRWVYRQSEQL